MRSCKATQSDSEPGTNSMTDALSKLLAGIGNAGSFATSRTVSTTDFKLEVEGVGRITLPVSTATAKALCAIAEPSRHGYKELTLLDRRVRDSWEIPARKIVIDEVAWSRTLRPQLEIIRRALGMPDSCGLRASLHNLLIYGPGQFFAAHQDTEKTEGMVATLAVGLPSKHRGGATVIMHHDEKLLVRGSATKLSLVAFYADCRHEVRAVSEGYRIALTYNLAIVGDTRSEAPPRGTLHTLAEGVRRHFDLPVPDRWNKSLTRPPPERLVYLLDHQYTQHGLAWGRLKRADAARVAALRAVADRLDCEAFLALADIHETWSCEPDFGPGRYGRRDWRMRFDDDDGEDYDDRVAATHDLIELIDSDVELRHWIGDRGQVEAISSRVDAGELCYTRPSADLSPFQTEHEGYTGNAGNTVDHWYHRAALVIWPRVRNFEIRAKASPSWAIGEIHATLNTDGPEVARTLTQRVLPFWGSLIGKEASQHLYGRTLDVAARLDDATMAGALLNPFPLERLSVKRVPRLLDCLSRYGAAWCRLLLQHWSERSSPPSAERHRWVEKELLPVCRAMAAEASADVIGLAQHLVASQWRCHRSLVEQALTWIPAKVAAKTLHGLSKLLLALVESAVLVNENDVHADIVSVLQVEASWVGRALGIGMLRIAHDTRHRIELPDLRLAPLQRFWSAKLTERVQVAPRAGDDWSIDTAVPCDCELCEVLRTFLRATDRSRHEWPLAEAKRRHIHGVIDHLALPVSHITRRQGSPFVLVVEKTDLLFRRRDAERRAWHTDLAWLERTSADFDDRA